jgi:hypothetical protein
VDDEEEKEGKEKEVVVCEEGLKMSWDLIEKLESYSDGWSTTMFSFSHVIFVLFVDSSAT